MGKSSTSCLEDLVSFGGDCKDVCGRMAKTLDLLELDRCFITSIVVVLLHGLGLLICICVFS